MKLLPREMTDWQEKFRDKLITADDAARRVKSADLVRLPLLNALARRRDELRGVRVLQGATTYEHPWTDEPGWEEQIEYVTDFVSPQTRDAMKARRIDFAVSDFSIGRDTTGTGTDFGLS